MMHYIIKFIFLQRMHFLCVYTTGRFSQIFLSDDLKFELTIYY
jgi:hypothetical protein